MSLNVATLQRDGWAGYRPLPGAKTATIVTVNLTVSQPRLLVSADASSPGSWVQAGLVGGGDRAASNSQRIVGTAVDRAVGWGSNNETGLEAWFGRSAQLTNLSYTRGTGNRRTPRSAPPRLLPHLSTRTSHSSLVWTSGTATPIATKC